MEESSAILPHQCNQLVFFGAFSCLNFRNLHDLARLTTPLRILFADFSRFRISERNFLYFYALCAGRFRQLFIVSQATTEHLGRAHGSKNLVATLIIKTLLQVAEFPSLALFKGPRYLQNWLILGGSEGRSCCSESCPKANFC